MLPGSENAVGVLLIRILIEVPCEGLNTFLTPHMALTPHTALNSTAWQGLYIRYVNKLYLKF